MPCHIFFCCLLEVDSLWTSNVLHLECYREGCEQLKPQDIWWTALLFVGWGLSRGLLEPRVVVVKSCTSMQCFNTLLVLSFHIVGSSLGMTCFSVLHSALISSVQASRTSWSDYAFFWGLVWSERTYRDVKPKPNLIIRSWCMVTDSFVNSLHLIQCLAFPDLSLSCFCWVKPRIVCQFAFLFSCPLSCLASALLSSARWLQAGAPLPGSQVAPALWV